MGWAGLFGWPTESPGRRPLGWVKVDIVLLASMLDNDCR